MAGEPPLPLKYLRPYGDPPVPFSTVLGWSLSFLLPSRSLRGKDRFLHLRVQRGKESLVFKKILTHKGLGKSSDCFKDLLVVSNAPS